MIIFYPKKIIVINLIVFVLCQINTASANTDDLYVLPVGISVNKQVVSHSILIRGAEDGSQATQFERWLIPLSVIETALQVSQTPLKEGLIELRSPYRITRIHSDQLKQDPELGLSLSIADIETLLHVPAHFDIDQYSIVFTPAVSNAKTKQTEKKQPTIITEGLSARKPAAYSLAGFGQTFTATGINGQMTMRGNLFALGNVGKGSWYLQADQSDMEDAETLRLSEGQYFLQSPSLDYALGSQNTFWPRQTNGDYWGLSVVGRKGFSSLQSSNAGFDPDKRRQAKDITQTVTGEADAGTLVQLVDSYRDIVIAETLVDASGIYQFEDISTDSRAESYKILLYPDGILSAIPEERDAQFNTQVGQLEVGASAWIVSAGLANTAEAATNFWEQGGEYQGGVSYRYGLADSLTLGVGLIYEQRLKSLLEMYLQPANVPIAMQLSALVDENGDLSYKNNLSWRIANNLNLSISSDHLSHRFYVNWRIFPKLSLVARTNSETNVHFMGVSYANTFKNQQFIYANVSADSNKNISYRFSYYWQQWRFKYKQDDGNQDIQINYNFSKKRSHHWGHQLTFDHKIREVNKQNNNFSSLLWQYESRQKSKDNRSLWYFNLGYGRNTQQQQGIIASLTTAIIPWLDIKFRYQSISINSDDTQFLLELSTNFRTQPKIDRGTFKLKELRGQGGLFVQPFLDKNNDGNKDDNEPIYSEHLGSLVQLNNEPLPLYKIQTTEQGMYAHLKPDLYRLDLDPAGYPIGAEVAESAYALAVNAGTYTPVYVPFAVSYTIAGTVRDSQNNPLADVKVDIVSIETGKKLSMLSNKIGIFFIDNVKQGEYKIMLDEHTMDQSVKIDQHSDWVIELDLIKPF